MKLKTRLFRPCVHSLEDRTVLSFSFTSLLHSVFPFLPDKTTKAKPRAAHLRTHSPVTSTLTPETATTPARVHAVRPGHIRALAQAAANPAQAATPTVTHPRGVFNWYAAHPAARHVKVR